MAQLTHHPDGDGRVPARTSSLSYALGNVHARVTAQVIVHSLFTSTGKVVVLPSLLLSLASVFLESGIEGY